VSVLNAVFFEQLEKQTAPAERLYPSEVGECVSLGNGDSVVITSSTSTGCTYITPVLTQCTSFLQLMRGLNDHCAVAAALDREPREKELLGCKFTDSLFYRGVVEEKLPNGQFRTFFVDYGNHQVCKLADLRALPADFKELPRQAVKVYFRDVDPVEVTGQIGAILEALSADEIQLKLRLDGSIDNGVELLRPDGQSVNEELRECIAKTRSPREEPSKRQPPRAAESSEDWGPVNAYPLPTDKAFKLLVLHVDDENFVVCGCDAGNPEIIRFEDEFTPKLLAHCAHPAEPYQPKCAEMCIALFDGGKFGVIQIS